MTVEDLKEAYIKEFAIFHRKMDNLLFQGFSYVWSHSRNRTPEWYANQKDHPLYKAAALYVTARDYGIPAAVHLRMTL